MTDPISSGGAGTIRYALSTGPALITMPPGLCIPICGWLGFVDQGITVGFTAGILLAMTTEYLRRGTITLRSRSIRHTLLAILTGIFQVTPVFAGIAVVLGIVAVHNCFGPTCSVNDHVTAVMGFVLSIIASLASVALVSLLRSPIWAQHRAASAIGP